MEKNNQTYPQCSFIKNYLQSFNIGTKTEWAVVFWETIAEPGLFKYFSENIVISLTIEH